MKAAIEQIDALLPQTQCGLCGYKGCLPYAQALAEQTATINLCPPGGIQGLLALAEITQSDPTPFLADMEKKAKPNLRAVIREAECIGCTKCIQACPVDAILGAGKLMHTVITDECTGCELCVAPCPVDCIDMVTTNDIADTAKKNQYRNRFVAREKRLAQEKAAVKPINSLLDDRKAYIQAALLRKKMKG